MKKRMKWFNRKVRYYVNRSLVGRILMRLYYELEGLIWLMVCVAILVVVVKVLIL